MAQFRFKGLQQGGCVEAQVGYAYIGLPGWTRVEPGDVVTISDTDIAVPERPCPRRHLASVQLTDGGVYVDGNGDVHMDVCSEASEHLIPAQTEADTYRAVPSQWEEVLPTPAPAPAAPPAQEGNPA